MTSWIERDQLDSVTVRYKGRKAFKYIIMLVTSFLNDPYTLCPLFSAKVIVLGEPIPCRK